ncbi:MAG: hypothetical protein ACRENE_18260 [Polyangiaceae bacterium]
MQRTGATKRLAAIALLTGVSAARNARADDRISLVWEAPPECPTKTQVARAIDAWLEPSRAGAATAAARVRVEALVRESEGGWELHLSLVAPGGSEEQTLVAARCETLVEVVAIKVALASDPIAFLRAPRPPVEDVGPPPAPRFGIRGALGAGLGPLPDASVFAALAGSVEVPGWRAELAGSAWLPRSASYPELPSVGASITLWSVGARGCAVPSMSGVEFPLCAGAELGVMRGAGFGVAHVETSDQLWVAAVAGPALRARLGSSTFLWLGMDAVLGIARPAYHMRNLEPLYQPDPVSARWWAGIELRM